MFGTKKNTAQRQAAQSVFTSSVYLFANVVALAAAYILTGQIYDCSIEWIQDYTLRLYGGGEAAKSIVSVFWFGVIALGTFAFARATIATALIMLGTAIAARFL